MRIQEIIQEFVPCEVCGNSDISSFYFHVFAIRGNQEPYVKCRECEEEYYSRSAKEVLNRIAKESKCSYPGISCEECLKRDCER